MFASDLYVGWSLYEILPLLSRSIAYDTRVLLHCKLIRWDLCSLLAYKTRLSSSVIFSWKLPYKLPMCKTLSFSRTSRSEQIDLGFESVLQHVAAGVFGVCPGLGRGYVLVSVEKAQSVYSGVGETCRTFRAGPEDERQSAQTRWLSRCLYMLKCFSDLRMTWEWFKPVLLICSF